MKIKDIIQDCTLGVTAYLNNDTAKDFISYLIYNKIIIEQFPNMVMAINSDEEDLSFIKKLLDTYAADLDIVFLDQNRGHMFGTMDLDEAIFELSKKYPQKYLFKISQDILIDFELLNTEIIESDFYFVPGFSLETILRNKGAKGLFQVFEDSSQKDFTPQSNFFILNKKSPNVYGGSSLITEFYNKFQEILKEKPNAKCWEEFPDPKFDCETFLGRTVQSQNLTHFNLLNESEFVHLWKTVLNYKIGDPSHKNIMLPCGICHFQFRDRPIIKLKRS